MELCMSRALRTGVGEEPDRVGQKQNRLCPGAEEKPFSRVPLLTGCGIWREETQLQRFLLLLLVPQQALVGSHHQVSAHAVLIQEGSSLSLPASAQSSAQTAALPCLPVSNKTLDFRPFKPKQRNQQKVWYISVFKKIQEKSGGVK